MGQKRLLQIVVDEGVLQPDAFFGVPDSVDLSQCIRFEKGFMVFIQKVGHAGRFFPFPHGQGAGRPEIVQPLQRSDEVGLIGHNVNLSFNVCFLLAWCKEKYKLLLLRSISIPKAELLNKLAD
jgi:hypothetical protein